MWIGVLVENTMQDFLNCFKPHIFHPVGGYKCDAYCIYHQNLPFTVYLPCMACETAFNQQFFFVPVFIVLLMLSTAFK